MHVKAAGGTGATVNGMTYTGMVTFSHSDVTISRSIFRDAGDDDGFNAKYSKVVIRDSLVMDNAHDGIDLDWPKEGSEIKNNHLTHNGIGGGEGGDAIDLSRSDVLIEGNTIDGCTDKGISVGEKSNPTIRNNLIAHCLIGIAVKDRSEAIIVDTQIAHTGTGITAYQKHPIYGGGIAHVARVRMEDVKEEYKKDVFSKIEIQP